MVSIAMVGIICPWKPVYLHILQYILSITCCITLLYKGKRVVLWFVGRRTGRIIFRNITCKQTLCTLFIYATLENNCSLADFIENLPAPIKIKCQLLRKVELCISDSLVDLKWGKPYSTVIIRTQLILIISKLQWVYDISAEIGTFHCYLVMIGLSFH